MCIIAAKPIGIDMPLEQTMKNMWNRNNDGAGIMYALEGKVHIEKGFMSWDRFINRVTELDNQYGLKGLAVVMHFRITTHGGTKPENTHPFPISDSVGMLRKLKLTTDLGVAHNGIISVTPRKDISDTMEYIAGQLAPLKRAMPKFYKNKDILQMIDHATGSKLAFLDGKGHIETVGNFIEDEGILYSNNSYERIDSWRDYYNYKAYGWDDYDNDEEVYDLASYKDDGTWTRYHTKSYTQRKVMWIDETRGEYVIDIEDGEYLSGEYAIDPDGVLYEYNYRLDVFEELPNCAQAYTAEGLPLKFNKNSNMISEELVLL